MQRHFSDPFGHQDPLGSGSMMSRKQQILQARGTVSMPTSPVLRATESAWAGMPTTAQFASVPLGTGAQDIQFVSLPECPLRQNDPFSISPTTAQPPSATSAIDSTAYHSQPYPATIFPGASYDLPLASPFIPHHRTTLRYSQDEDEGDQPPRKKRAQVRIACTHCQKACKKCSNTRPCERCVKYGLKGCVDSTRKPRKTGIKRGPYKRRSSKFALSPSSAGSPPPPLGASDSTAFPTYPAAQNNTPGPWWGSRRPSNANNLSQALYPPAAGSSNIPPPRGPSLSSAFSAALNGPRWVNGQRISGAPQSSAAINTVAASGSGGFPLSLHHSADPFSRAVSPIRQTTNTVNMLGSAPFVSTNWNSSAAPLVSPSGETQVSPAEPISNSMDVDIPGSAPLAATSSSPWMGGTLPWDSQIASAPTSPRATASWPDLIPRPASAEPPFAVHPHSAGPSFARFAPGIHSPAMIALKKIRKPSLRTLMSPLSSAGQSRTASPTGGAGQSPTLFQGGMTVDDVPALSWDLPDGGASLQAGASRDLRNEGPTPMEGLALTLDNVFQT